MRSLYHAIIHLREPVLPSIIEPKLRVIRGVEDVQCEPSESLVTVQFDREQTGLAEIVRAIEDSGPSVSGVAQRRIAVRRAG